MRRWLVAGTLAVVGTGFLVWAFPRFHASARLGLAFDREGYLAKARAIAAEHGKDVSGWRGYIKAETRGDNQQLRRRMASDPLAVTFPPSVIRVTFLPHDSSAAATVRLRADGRPLNWDLPVGKHGKDAPGSGSGAADAALREIAGADAARFHSTTSGTLAHDGLEYAWEEVEDAPDTPRVRIDTFIVNGHVVKAETEFTIPESLQHRWDSTPALQITAGVLWFALMVAAFVVPILREGAANVARSMKDMSAVWLAVGAAVLLAMAGIFGWDDSMIGLEEGGSGFGEVLGLLAGVIFTGLLFYAVMAGSFLNARLHASKLRGLRLLPTTGVWSRLVGAEVLGGFLVAPALVAIPLALSAILGRPLAHGYLDDLLLSPWRPLVALGSLGEQEILTPLVMLGLLFPLALRVARAMWLRILAIAFVALVTFVTLHAPFGRLTGTNFVSATLSAGLLLWAYVQFGVLGAAMAYEGQKLISAAGTLLVQPASSIHTAGWGVVALICGIGVCALVAARQAPEITEQLYGETGSRVVPRTRREELLAEFNVARSAQRQMLPASAPHLEGYSIAASCEPAREVGGDLYDFLTLRDGRVGIGVADVSGKGVPAALYMTLTKGLLCAASQDSDDPHEILTAVNTHLREAARKKVFVTMAFGALDPRSGVMEYVRAGHNPMVWRRYAARETRLLEAGGMGLGLSGPVLFAKTLVPERISLENGDALVFYSDGLTEAMNGSLEQFGEERLMAAVEQADGWEAQATMDNILREVKTFLSGGQPQDDLTVAVLRVGSVSNGARS